MENGGGTLNVLRKGFSHLAAKFQMCAVQARVDAQREDGQADYGAVRVRVMRQVHFSTADQRSVDLVLFVNGLPVATLELKTDFTQTVADAIEQYKTTRLPEGPRHRAGPAAVRLRRPRAGALRGVQRRGLDDHQAGRRQDALPAVQPGHRGRRRRQPAQPERLANVRTCGSGSCSATPG